MKSIRLVMITATLILIIGTVFAGCSSTPTSVSNPKEKVAKASLDNSKLFSDLEGKLDEQEIKSIAIIRVDDMINHDKDRERQVYQTVLQELTKFDGLKVVEGDMMAIEDFLKSRGIDPSRGLSAESAISLASLLKVDSLIYGTIESGKCDVNIKVYTGLDGEIIVSEMLKELSIPIDNRKEKFELPEEIREKLSDTNGST